VSAAERFGAYQIRLSDFSIFNAPPRPSVMAIMKGYMDDSRKNDRLWIVGGYLGGHHHWVEFENRWSIMLAVHGVPYFHMKEMGKSNGPFAKWQPREEHQKELDLFFKDITQIIRECNLWGFHSIARINDLNRFNFETGLSLDPYSLAAYGCLQAMVSVFGNETIEVVFDNVEKVHSKLARAMEYAESDPTFGKDMGKIVAIPLGKNLTFRAVTPLQAADFVVWETGRHHANADEWFSLPDKPLGELERWEHFVDFHEKKIGNFQPVPRKSLQALIENNVNHWGVIWDYDQLCRVNQLRAGVWN
jgi:hypothetical protein